MNILRRLRTINLISLGTCSGELQPLRYQLLSLAELLLDPVLIFSRGYIKLKFWWVKLLRKRGVSHKQKIEGLPYYTNDPFKQVLYLSFGRLIESYETDSDWWKEVFEVDEYEDLLDLMQWWKTEYPKQQKAELSMLKPVPIYHTLKDSQIYYFKKGLLNVLESLLLLTIASLNPWLVLFLIPAYVCSWNASVCMSSLFRGERKIRAYSLPMSTDDSLKKQIEAQEAIEQEQSIRLSQLALYLPRL